MRTLLIVCLACSWSQAQQPPKVAPTAEHKSAEAAADQKESNRRQQPADKSAAAVIDNHATAIPNKSAAETKTEQELQINWWLAAFTLALVAVGATQTGTLVWQARVLRHHSRLIEQSVEQMRRAVGAYQQFAEASQGMLTLTRESNEITSEVAKAATRSAEAATLSADIAKRSLEIVQAADVSVVGIASSDETCIRTGSVIGVIVKNHGRTRAEGLTVNISLSVGARTVAVPALPPFVLPADAVQSIQIEQAVRWLAADDFMKIETRVSQLSVAVDIRYKDVFRTEHSARDQAAFVVGRGFGIAGNQPVIPEKTTRFSDPNES